MTRHLKHTLLTWLIVMLASTPGALAQADGDAARLHRAPAQLAAYDEEEEYEEDAYGDEEAHEEEAYEDEEEVGPQEEIERLYDELDEMMPEPMRRYAMALFPEAAAYLSESLEEADERGNLERQRQILEMTLDLSWKLRELQELEYEHPELFEPARGYMEAELTSRIMAERFRHAQSDEERENMRRALREVLERGFDMSQRWREMEAQTVERELERIRELLEMRRDNRALIIDRRMMELLMGEDPYAW